MSTGLSGGRISYSKVLRTMFSNAANVEDVLLASHLLKSSENIRILPDIQHCGSNLIRNNSRESREIFFAKEIL